MSWNKNTVKSTKIDDTIEVLRENNIFHTLEILGTAQGRGLNDSYSGTHYYYLRKLSYQNFVIMERMVRDPDCDIDDVIKAEKFEKDNVPENWELETEIEDLIGDIVDIKGEENYEMSAL